MKPSRGARKLPCVLLAGPSDRVDALAGALSSLNVRLLQAPVVDVLPVSDTSELDRALRAAAPYDWAVFTSARGVEAVAARCAALGAAPASIAKRVAAVGPSTARAAREAGFADPVTPARYVTAAITDTLGPLEAALVLLARADLAGAELASALAARGARVTAVDAYRTVAAPIALPPAAAAAADLAVFTSASGVRFLSQALGEAPLKALARRAGACCIGPVTAQAAHDAGFRRVVSADPHTTAGLLALIEREVAARA